MKGNIVNILLRLKNLGKTESSIETISHRLKHLMKNCNLEDPESVTKFLVEKEGKGSYKNKLGQAYEIYAKYRKFVWERPRFRKIRALELSGSVMPLSES